MKLLVLVLFFLGIMVPKDLFSAINLKKDTGCKPHLVRQGRRSSADYTGGSGDFQASLFAESKRAALVGNVNSDFPKKCAEWADAIDNNVERGEVALAFERLAELRNRYYFEKNPDAQKTLYGILEDKDAHGHEVSLGYVNRNGKVWTATPPYTLNEIQYLEDALRNYEKDILSIQPGGTFRVEHSVTSLDGRHQIPTKAVLIARDTNSPDGTFSFKTETMGGALPLNNFHIAQVRANRAISAKLKSDQLNEFALSAYAFFTSMPYKKGSATIGRVFYTTLAKKIFGVGTKLDAEIDIHALTKSEHEFKEWLSAQLN